MKSIKANWINWALGLLLGLVILGGLQYASRGHFADPDGFYHARASQLLNAGELSDTFPWLFFTTWNENYANQHYLYHWLLNPFNTVEKLPISIVVFGLVFIALFIAVLTKYKISYKPFWVLLLLGSSVDFLFRISLVKANTVSLALLCAIVLLIYSWHVHRNKYSLLGIGLVSGIFVWTYGGFICVPFLLGAYAAAEIISQRFLTNLKIISAAILPALISVAGIAFGMTLHPQSHHIYSLMYDQLFRTGLGAGSVVPAGNEWLAFNIDWFFKSNILILFAWVFSLCLLFRNVYAKREVKPDQTLALWLQITAIGLIAITLWHRRFIEYSIPFTVLATAVTLQPHLLKLKWQELKTTFNFWQMKVAVLLIAILVLGVGAHNVRDVHRSLHNGDSGTSYKEAAVWLEENSESGDIVLNTQWDQFPQLFYYDSKNYYIVGLDPTFMYIQNPGKYWRWRLIADDNPEQWQSIEQIHEVISKDLSSKFIFIDKDRNSDLADYLATQNSQLFSVGYSDDSIVVYKVE
jgi:hypothetical protein